MKLLLVAILALAAFASPALAQQQYKPVDRDGNGGWWIIEGRVRAVYLFNGVSVVIQTDDRKVHVVTINPSLYGIPPVWAGEHAHLEYGGRDDGENFVFKVWELPEPATAAPPSRPTVVYVIRNSRTRLRHHPRRMKRK